jgi:hypothetical protein
VSHRMRRRALVLAVVIAGLGVPLALPTPALALSTAPPTPVDTVDEDLGAGSKSVFPASILVDVAGDVLPSSRADVALSYTMDNYQTNGGIMSDVAEGYQIAEHIPGFRLGTKIGGWIDDALGIDPPPAPGYSAVALVNSAGTAGWSGGTSVLGFDGKTYSFAADSAILSAHPYATGPAGDLGGQPPAQGYLEVTPVYFNGSQYGAAVKSYANTCPEGDYPESATGVPGLSEPLAFNTSGASDPHTIDAAINWCYNQTRGQFHAPNSLTITGADGHSITYFPPGSPGYAATEASGSTAIEWQMHTVCGASDAYDDYSDSFPADAANFAGVPQIHQCPTGETLKSYTLTVDMASDLSVLQTVETWTNPIPGDLTANYPACANQLCVTTLWQLQPDGTYADCFEDEAASCDGWATDPNKSSTYVCTYAPEGTAESAAQDIGLDGCAMYGDMFDPVKRGQGVIVTDPIKVGSPVHNKPAPIESPPACISGCTGSTEPSPTPTPNASCWPSGLSQLLDFMAWIYKPIECALQWAFVPKTSDVTDLTDQFKADLGASTVDPWVSAIGGLLPAGGSGCKGPPVTLSILDGIVSDSDGGDTLYPFDACDEPMATVALVTRSVATIGIIIGGGWVCMNAITAAFGYKADD